MPLVLLLLVVVHLMALHEVGSNNPDGIEIKDKKDPLTGHPLDGIPFHPYYTVKDLVGVVVFLALFSVVVFFWPDGGGYFLERDNFIPANPLQTPSISLRSGISPRITRCYGRSLRSSSRNSGECW